MRVHRRIFIAMQIHQYFTRSCAKTTILGDREVSIVPYPGDE